MPLDNHFCHLRKTQLFRPYRTVFPWTTVHVFGWPQSVWILRSVIEREMTPRRTGEVPIGIPNGLHQKRGIPLWPRILLHFHPMLPTPPPLPCLHPGVMRHREPRPQLSLGVTKHRKWPCRLRPHMAPPLVILVSIIASAR